VDLKKLVAPGLALTILAGLLLLAPDARAQQQSKVARLGYLGFGAPATSASRARVEQSVQCREGAHLLAPATQG